MGGTNNTHKSDEKRIQKLVGHREYFKVETSLFYKQMM
jgi:hypothetical protein